MPRHEQQKTATIAAFLDEFEKIGVDAAMAMEGMGVPGALYAGYKKSGLRGLGTTGLGAVGGLGLGALGGHYVKKLTDRSSYLKSHPILKAIADSAPIGLGGVMGGAVGEHFAGGHGHAQRQLTKVSGALAQYLLKKVNPILALDVVNDVGKIPARMQQYENMRKEELYGEAAAAQGG